MFLINSDPLSAMKNTSLSTVIRVMYVISLKEKSVIKHLLPVCQNLLNNFHFERMNIEISDFKE